MQRHLFAKGISSFPARFDQSIGVLSAPVFFEKPKSRSSSSPTNARSYHHHPWTNRSNFYQTFQLPRSQTFRSTSILPGVISTYRFQSTGNLVKPSAVSSTPTPTTASDSHTSSPVESTSAVVNDVPAESVVSANASDLSTSSEAVVSSAATAVDSIPEPPTIPIEDLVTITAEKLAAYGGEAPFSEIGLGGWSPSGIVQQCLEYLHITGGLPWWACILTGTVVIRILLFPLVIKSQRNAAKMNNNMPQMQALQMKMTEARQSGNALLAARYGQEMLTFMKEKDINPLKNMLVPLAMAPVFISFFFGLRGMANLPVDSLKTGGLFWFTDLTVADPYYILPVITSVTILATLELGTDGAKLSASPHGYLIKYFLRLMPVLVFPFTMNFPAAVLCYWVSTNGVSLIQVSLLKIPKIREALKIEKLVEHQPTELPMNAKKKGFVAGVKESWTNMKITKELEDRERYDEAMFNRAGKGPIPKTYKYDPTKSKAAENAAAALQAKKGL